VLPANAQSISKEKALTAAQHFLLRSGNAAEIQTTDVINISKNTNELVYIFELTPRGYIVISGDTNLTPVIAYSFENNVGDVLSENNELISFVKSDLCKRLSVSGNACLASHLKQNKSWNKLTSKNYLFSTDSTFQQWPPAGSTPTGGWLKYNWTQNSPYNNFCPMDPVTSQRSIAGCPAVAMAQILSFHQSINNTTFNNSDDYYHNYAGRQYWIDDDYLANSFPSFPMLNAYLDTLNMHYINHQTTTNNDKAALVFACGVAATQVYTSSGSGTFGVSQAYDAYQRFSCTQAVLLDTSDADLFPRLMQNMKDTLPAHLAIVDSAWSSGHNVVVDGYNTDGYYHLNFGWGGSYNAWYLVPQDIPYNLTVIEGVILDIKLTSAVKVNESNYFSNDFNLFPNPASDFINIKFNSDAGCKASLQLFSTNGQLIYNCDHEMLFEKNVKKINISFLPKGIYYVHIFNNSLNFVGKFIKQ